MEYKCPHCGGEVNPGKMLGGIRTPKREAAWKRNGERLKVMYANAMKVGVIDSVSPGRGDRMEVEIVHGHVAPPPSIPRLTYDSIFKGSDLPPKPTTLEEKKERARLALASIGGGEPQPLSETPCAPFDVNLEGEGHRVVQVGKRLCLFFLGAGEPVFNRYLVDGELETLWEKRIKK